MFRHLQLTERRERILVGLADLGLAVLRSPSRLRSRVRPAHPGRILLLRLERMGDLVMTRAAISLVRTLAPSARIDLAVGSWNASLARMLPDVDTIEELDLGWLARDISSRARRGMTTAVQAWRARRYDLGINFEGDIRSHVLLYAAGPAWTAGFGMAGGGPLLDEQVHFDPVSHTADNAIRLVEQAFGRPGAGAGITPPQLVIPDAARAFAAHRLADIAVPHVGERRPLVGIHASGGRLVKQWSPARFAVVATELSRMFDAAMVLTGSLEDRPMVEAFRAALPHDVPVIDLSGALDVPQLAAVLERLTLFVSGDTGPMHLASAVGAPVVGVFGPSDPRRWGPLGPRSIGVRVDLPCSPCNRIRRPPGRCTGRIPDCLEAVGTPDVVAAAVRILRLHNPSASPHGDV
ncbi:MAG: glycosyltransferase family 9 protein [Acidobacteriota bacterium]